MNYATKIDKLLLARTVGFLSIYELKLVYTLRREKARERRMIAINNLTITYSHFLCQLYIYFFSRIINIIIATNYIIIIKKWSF